jgi:hypothetical protein
MHLTYHKLTASRRTASPFLGDHQETTEEPRSRDTLSKRRARGILTGAKLMAHHAHPLYTK